VWEPLPLLHGLILAKKYIQQSILPMENILHLFPGQPFTL